MRTRITSRIGGYSVAVAAVAIALALRMGLSPWISDRAMFLPFFFAIAVTATVAGMKPGLLATALSVLAADWFLIPPLGSLWISETEDQLAFMLFLLMASFICWLAGSRHSARVQLEESRETVRRDEERLRLATNVAGLGTWDWDVKSGKVSWNDNLFSILGYAPSADSTVPIEWWSSRVHPADQSRVMQALEDAKSSGSFYNPRYRILRADDGQTAWVEVMGRFFRDEHGQPARMIGAMLEITQRKRLEEQLQERMDQLAQADRSKDEFLATLAHELRSPLTSIVNAIDFLQADNSLPADPQWAKGVIERQADQMIRLVDELLDVSRISCGKLRLNLRPTDLADVVHVAVETSRPQIEAARHELTLSLPPEPLLLNADPMRLAQMLSNLLNNAAKYTEQGGQIQLALERRDGHALLSVKDNGIGIEASMLPRVFEIFSQVNTSLHRSQSGLGIGLSLVKAIAELHGGGVQACSDGLGRGSEFTVRLPLSAEPPAPGRDKASQVEGAARERHNAAT